MCNRKHLTDACFSFVLMEISFDYLLQQIIQIRSSHQWILLTDFEWRVCGTMGFSFTSNQDFLPAIPCESNTNQIHKMSKGLFPSDSCQKLSRVSSVAFKIMLQHFVMSPHKLSELSCVFNQFGREGRPRIFSCWVKGGV